MRPKASDFKGVNLHRQRRPIAIIEDMERMDRLFDKGIKLTEHIGVMEGRIRGAITAYAVLVAKGFIQEGFEVYTYGNFPSACIHEGGLPAILVKGLPGDGLKRWEDKASLLWISDYDEYIGKEH